MQERLEPVKNLHYKSDRRLAAAIGNVVGIPDDAITTPLPTGSPGFGSPAALNSNIKLARLAGKITQSEL